MSGMRPTFSAEITTRLLRSDTASYLVHCCNESDVVCSEDVCTRVIVVLLGIRCKYVYGYKHPLLGRIQVL